MTQSSHLPAIGAAMEFYEFAKGRYPTAKQIQELFAVIGIHVPLEYIEADKALLLALRQEELGLLSNGSRTTHD